MDAVLELKEKKRGSEKRNSTRAMTNVKALSAPSFSLSMKRRAIAPASGKKIKRERMGIPRIVIQRLLLPSPSPRAKEGKEGDGTGNDLEEDRPHDIVSHEN